MPIYSLADYKDFIEPREDIGPIGVDLEGADLIINKVNLTDPDVFIDPDFPRPIIIKQFSDPEGLPQPVKRIYPDEEKQAGVVFPLIRIDNIVLNRNQIRYFKLFYENNLPKVIIEVSDNDQLLQTINTPGLNNTIAICIMPEENGYFKKIALGFYVTKFEIKNDLTKGNYNVNERTKGAYKIRLYYEGVVHVKEMQKEMFKYFHLIPEYKKPKLTTWELLWKIATDHKVGFASTHECKNIVDIRYRTVQTKTLFEYIDEQVSIGGLDDNSIFEWWFDFYGYINLINIPWVFFNSGIDPKNLAGTAFQGLTNTTYTDMKTLKALFLPRILSDNKTQPGEHNLMFQREKSKYVVETEKIFKEGAANSNFFMTLPSNKNQIFQTDLQIIDNSTSGNAKAGDYSHQKLNFKGIEFDKLEFIEHKITRSKLFDKIKYKKLKIQLDKCNYGLQRGMLVNIVFRAYEKQDQINNSPHEEKSMETKDMGKVDIFASGIYYIDDVDFEYLGSEAIFQHLYVVNIKSWQNSIDTHLEPINLLNTDKI